MNYNFYRILYSSTITPTSIRMLSNIQSTISWSAFMNSLTLMDQYSLLIACMVRVFEVSLNHTDQLMPNGTVTNKLLTLVIG